MEDTATRRHAILDGSVDGQPTKALPVMSQGELHALALALFLPRCENLGVAVPAATARSKLLVPRSLEEVPPAELAHHLADLAEFDELLSEEELFRAVLDRLGLKRLTDNANTVLSRARELVPATMSSGR